MKSNEISVVVQGVIDEKITPKCLKSIRKYLPEAKVILSTWEGSNTANLEYDLLLLNKDPGGNNCSIDGKGINNCNREIISSFAGIKASNRKYVLKIRSDIVLTNSNILKIKFLNKQREKSYAYLSERVLVCSVYSRYYAINTIKKYKTPVLFHPSDWLYFGLKDDIYSLFNIPLTDEPAFSQWFRHRPNERNGYVDTHPYRLWRFSPEAYIWTEYLRKNHNINIEDKLDITDETIELSRHSLVNNFYMADMVQLGIKMPKYNIIQALMPKTDRGGLYTNWHWQKEYQTFCDKNYIVKPTICFIMHILADLFKIKRRKR